MFDLTLNKVSEEGEAAEISFKTDVDAVADNIMSLLNAYNGILSIAENTSQEATGDINKLFSEMSALSRGRRESLGNIGLVVADNGTISIDKEKLEDAIQPDKAETTFTRLTNFKNALGDKAYKASINPMHYVNKVVVNYKNPSKTFPAPYFSSVYSGMMLDRYV
jgi:flagellar hook-associated protein 2